MIKFSLWVPTYTLKGATSCFKTFYVTFQTDDYDSFSIQLKEQKEKEYNEI